MPRVARSVVPGVIYHVLNRARGRRRLFHEPADFAAFETVLAEALQRFPDVELLTYCLMSDHWHLVLRPRTAGALGRFMRWVGVTHVRRHQERHRTRGGGNLYQGRYKSFPVQADEHLLMLCRHVESNPLRAGRVRRAEKWRWSGLAVHLGTAAGAKPRRPKRPQTKAAVPTITLAPWPVERPRNWPALVNEPLADAEAEKIRTSIRRGRPYGADAWIARTAARHGLEFTLRARGRPRKPRPTPSPKPPARARKRGGK